MKIGSPMRMYRLVPSSQYLRVAGLSSQAKLRLKWMDYYNKCGSVSKTCRYFGINRSTFYKWQKRYQPRYILSLENHSRRPKNLRKPTTAPQTVELIKKLRAKHPEYSKYKLAVILKRNYQLTISPSTIGRVMIKYNLFYTSKKRRKYKKHQSYLSRTIKPKELQARSKNQIFEFDVKHLPSIKGSKRYAFCTIDVFSKRADVFVSSTMSSTQAVEALKQAVKRLGLPQILVSDHGSENLKHFQKYLDQLPTTHYYCRLRTPRDKPHIERFIGTLQRECLNLQPLGYTVADQQIIINTWLAKYHYFRPHSSLNYLTPIEFLNTIKKATTKVSTMY